MTHVLQEQTCEDKIYKKRFPENTLLPVDLYIIPKSTGFLKKERVSTTQVFKYEIKKLGRFLLIIAELLQNQPETSSYNLENPTAQVAL